MKLTARYIPFVLSVIFFMLFWFVWQYSWTFNNTMNVAKYLDGKEVDLNIPTVSNENRQFTKQLFNIITIDNLEASWRDQILSDMNYPYRDYTLLIAMAYDSDYTLQYLNWISALFLGISMSCMTFYIVKRDKSGEIDECANCEV